VETVDPKRTGGDRKINRILLIKRNCALDSLLIGFVSSSSCSQSRLVTMSNSNRTPRFNLKIPPVLILLIQALRPRFQEPNDMFLSYMLDLSMEKSSFGNLISNRKKTSLSILVLNQSTTDGHYGYHKK
jgi:hypothetical protein